MRKSMKNPIELDEIINEFLNYERPEVTDLRKALEQFKEDLPTILATLRKIIEEQSKTNEKFISAREKFRKICEETINPNITLFDIREMIIQHILTEDMFINIFDDAQFHQKNNIAKQLKNVINTFFVGKVKTHTLNTIEHYYAVISTAASNISNHHEKQKFLKVLYETFYKAYNPKGADRLGIVYTPNEIVRFMIESTDYLLEKHFGKLLSDKNVQILDPATGTGTFITEIIEYIPKTNLKYKYKDEIHCNEVSILPYYIANLNIEYTYMQKMEDYEPFENICFADTLDNMGFTKYDEDGQAKLFSLSTENLERVKKQNEKKLSVIIGNPPYMANQTNENDKNKNRKYLEIDKKIKQTYVKESNAQKTKTYDMYSRFFRWASDRLSENGVLAFITNSSFIDAKTYDGFRKVVGDEFNEIYIVDLGGNLRKDKKEAKANVFGIKIGVAISYLIKNEKLKNEKCRIFYTKINLETAKEKLAFLSSTKFRDIVDEFQHIQPDKKHNWINITDNDYK